ncbi:MAG TPA: hypothetical protein VD996_17460 [Chitinophagaceae bacterium]|nr:hypothetical protein [Chitinophagaceae bacterium]
MLQPFEPFREKYIDRLLELNKPYLVSQTYTRSGNKDQEKVDLLLTDYDTLGEASDHLGKLKSDMFAAVIDLGKSGHRELMHRMLSTDSSFNFYWAIIKSARELEKQLNTRYKSNLRRYLDNCTNWRFSRGTTVEARVEVVYGELVVILTQGSRTMQVKFEDIEKS